MTTTYETITDRRGQYVTATYEGHVGAARVLSAGLEDAKQRAEAQAKAKAAKANANA